MKFRFNGDFKRIPNYIITREGKIIQLLGNTEHSEYFKNPNINRNSIIISLENLGWLQKEPLTDHYINWIGDIYKGKEKQVITNGLKESYFYKSQNSAYYMQGYLLLSCNIHYNLASKNIDLKDQIYYAIAEIYFKDKNIDKACELEAMISTVQEFMSSFIILGYDMNHQPIQPIVFAHNQQEADSLGAYLSKFIHHNIKEIDPSAE